MKWRNTEILHEGITTGEEIKEAKGIKIKGNRFDRRKRIRQPLNVTLRQAKRVDRFMKLKNEASELMKNHPDDFKDQERWKELEIEIAKILTRKGESNYTKPKAQRTHR